MSRRRTESMTLALHTTQTPPRTLLVTVHGIVQGVGFRPFVYRLAHRFGLTGSVINNGDGVLITIQGPSDQLDLFVRALAHEAPPVARILRLEVEAAGPDTPAAKDFRILASERAGRPSTQIAPDLALCPDCAGEILDPDNRRYLYPFTNCTNCGPRFSIVEHVPYDRPNTSMRLFEMCGRCAREYHDPLDRRFHAQPNACPDCGPALSWHDQDGRPLEGDCLTRASHALAQGRVVAIKGLGGFHLAVDGTSDAAVALLRVRKRRPAKPLAIMVADLEIARRFARISPEEEALLISPEHPIVLLPRRKVSALAENLAPGLGMIGIMLPYTPLHLLLLTRSSTPEALVMTSGNASDEPICLTNDEALNRLRGLADFFLLHNREIVTRVDDSVVRIMDGRVRLLRRARGYSPVPLVLHQPVVDLLACGAEMKSSFCIVRNNEAYISQHIGEISRAETYDFYQESIAHLGEVLETVPARVICDRHPDYQSSRYARTLNLPCLAIQHHHAHIGAVMAEHDLAGPVLGIVLDGAGYSDDGTVFGGEIFQADRSGYQRLGRLGHLLLPGGDRAALEPWRMGLSLIHAGLGLDGLAENRLPPGLAAIDQNRRNLIAQLLDKGINTPATSSCGRLFDAVASLLGLCQLNAYEGQAAMLLEHRAATAPPGEASIRYPVTFGSREGVRVIQSAPLAALILGDLRNGVAVGDIALRFHRWLCDALVALVCDLASDRGLKMVALAGGCMQNKLLYESLAADLRGQGLGVYGGEMVPMNDGGISLGQAFLGGTPCV